MGARMPLTWLNNGKENTGGLACAAAALSRLADQRFDRRDLALLQVEARVDLHLPQPLAEDQMRAERSQPLAFEPFAIASSGELNFLGGIAERDDLEPGRAKVSRHLRRRREEAGRRGLGPRHRVDERLAVARAQI